LFAEGLARSDISENMSTLPRLTEMAPKKGIKMAACFMSMFWASQAEK